MLFNTFLYFIFLFAFLVIFYILARNDWKKGLILLSSYGFYAYWDYRFCFLLLGLSLLTYLLAGRIEKNRDASAPLVIGIAVNLLALLIFRYFNFFIESFEVALGLNSGLGYIERNLIFPVGVSFYTLQSIAYLIDVKKQRTERANLLDTLVYIAFFPKLVAGPLVRSYSFLPQLKSPLKANRQQVESGAFLIVIGLFRKVLIADPAGKYVDNIFKQPEYFLGPEILCALFLFAIQIYADFSAYTFIARGSAKLMGIEMMRNFKFPLFSRNIIDFWQRWHISFAEWFKDYLYLPLNNNNLTISFIPLLITALIAGFWHGADWNFLIFGLYHGLVIWITSKVVSNNYSSGITIKLSDIPAILITFFVVLIGWFFYRIDDLSDLPIIMDKFQNWESSEVSMTMVQITLVFVVTVIILEIFEHLYQIKKSKLINNKYVRLGAMLAIFGMTLLYMFQTEPSAFIYFHF
ncbi:MAG: MBOAT family protein [Chitinophagales bacterium]|nr:MBOAT family protein [Chitinophagales bacterium]